MPMIPVCLKPDPERPCLIAGGGRVALHKARWLLRCGARVVALSPAFDEEFAALASQQPQQVSLIAGRCPGHPAAENLQNYQLVIAATNDAAANAALAEAARSANVLFNAVDQPELCGFYVPAMAQRGELQIAVSTAGQAPALAKAIRMELEDRYPADYAMFANALGDARREALTLPLSADERLRMMDALAASVVRGDYAGLDFEMTRKRLLEQIAAWQSR